MINIYKDSYTYLEENRLYLIHNDLVVVFEGEKLISIIQSDLKRDLLSVNLMQLTNSIEAGAVTNLLDGKVTINYTTELLDEYQLQAYAKFPTSQNTCAGGAVSADGPTMSDDGSCAPAIT